MEPSSGPDHSLLSYYSRDDKRYTEKKNKSERARRKKEDTARLRNIVDVALSADPRIKRIKQEEKEAREAKRKTKTGPGAGLSKAQAEEEKRRAEEEAKAKEEAEKVNLLHRSKCPFLTDDLCRLRRQRQRRRRPQLPMPRRKHAALRELRGLTLRNSGPWPGSCTQDNVSFGYHCLVSSHCNAFENLSGLCTREAQKLRLCDVWVVCMLSKLLGSTILHCCVDTKQDVHLYCSREFGSIGD